MESKCQRIGGTGNGKKLNDKMQQIINENDLGCYALYKMEIHVEIRSKFERNGNKWS